MAASMKFAKTAFQKVLTITPRRNNQNCVRLFHKCHKPQSKGLTSGLFVANDTAVLRNARVFQTAYRYCTNEVKEDESKDESKDEYHSIIQDTEKVKGDAAKHEFQAETRKLLDIVAKSLYSEKEVFVRELISNGSDALEKLRYVQTTADGISDEDLPLEIDIAANDTAKTLTIQDTGIGLTREELISNLGTIARSGSKEFLEQVESDGTVDRSIIGQFGVGFYSTFMVGDKVEVFTKSYKPDSEGLCWTSDGLGSYEVSEAEGVKRGTKVVIHLKGDAYDYAKEDTIKDIIKKYSNFVGVPIYLNGKRINVVEALWTKEPRSVTREQHEDFYRFVAGAYDQPRYHLHYRAEAPLDIKALFYVPENKPSTFDMSRDMDVSVTLYSRKVMIMSKANHILPRWLRFLKGVVDSEDIPLNLSRELLQDSNLIRKIRWVLTNRLIKFFQEQAKKDPAKYLEFYDDYGLFFREGIVTTPEQDQREDIAKLLRFESSALDPGVKTSIAQYGERMEAGSRIIYYLSAPNRILAESSPYMETMKKKGVEVLYCFEPYDELVLMNLGQFEKKNFKSVENEAIDVDTSSDDESRDTSGLTDTESEDLIGWLRVTLGNKIKGAKVTHRLVTHPCVLTVAEMGAARHFLKTAFADRSDEEKYQVLQGTLEINPSHPIITKLHSLKSTDADLARLVADQLFDNALIAAGLIDDPRRMLARINELLTKTLEKH